ncbi:uncharacterized protein VTP21DRAFT_7243 [Calcarisporiella thermophila]|uniref:uncharacterized protein n=1 Tax=Calcarisporiella thermophila TaxID=911321 RepID=UPI003741EE14
MYSSEMASISSPNLITSLGGPGSQPRGSLQLDSEPPSKKDQGYISFVDLYNDGEAKDLLASLNYFGINLESLSSTPEPTAPGTSSNPILTVTATSPTRAEGFSDHSIPPGSVDCVLSLVSSATSEATCPGAVERPPSTTSARSSHLGKSLSCTLLSDAPEKAKKCRRDSQVSVSSSTYETATASSTASMNTAPSSPVEDPLAIKRLPEDPLALVTTKNFKDPNGMLSRRKEEISLRTSPAQPPCRATTRSPDREVGAAISLFSVENAPSADKGPPVKEPDMPLKPRSLVRKKSWLAPLLVPPPEETKNSREEMGGERAVGWEEDDEMDIAHEMEAKSDANSVLQPNLVRKNVGESMEEQAREMAKRCFEENESFLKKEQVAEFLGNNKEFNACVLHHYMKCFDFKGLRVDIAFRYLCSRLFLRGETQQQDRILEAFAKRYWECNPDSIFENADVVHAVAYALLLLNTDLHLAVSSRKMSRSEFIKNTLIAIRSQIEDTHSNSNSNPPKGSSPPRLQGIFSLPKRTSVRKSYVSGSSNRTEQLIEIEALLKEIYSSIRSSQILQPTDSTSPQHWKPSHHVLGTHMGGFASSSVISLACSSSGRPSREGWLAPGAPRPSIDGSTDTLHTSFSATRRYAHSSASLFSSPGCSDDDGASIRTTSTFRPSSDCRPPLLGVPYAKEGRLVRKHLLDREGIKAKHRDWKECFVVVERGRLRMFLFDAHQQNRLAHSVGSRSTSSLADPRLAASMLGSGRYTVRTSMLGEIGLRHTLAKTLPPPGYSRGRPHVFALTLSTGAVYLFQASSAALVREFVETCNYWAARESKEPMLGGVSNIEYGWGRCLENPGSGVEERIIIQEWTPPAPPSVASMFDEATQMDSLSRHVQALETELEKHSEAREAMEKLFVPKSVQHAKAMSNWERKSKYLLHELVKYQEYADSLKKSMKLQDERRANMEK